jgi:hypothetical protein
MLNFLFSYMSIQMYFVYSENRANYTYVLYHSRYVQIHRNL